MHPFGKDNDQIDNNIYLYVIYMARPPNWRDIGPWNKTDETRDEYAIRTLNIAFDVHFDEDDREFHGDIRYDDLQRNHDRTLASEGGRWRGGTTPVSYTHLRAHET